MWDGKNKALTFSYDDGISQDKRLVEIFNKYGMKCTFNLNSGIMSENGSFIIKDVPVRRLTADECKEIYTGHEIAVHTLTHPSLTELEDNEIRIEIMQDKESLEIIFGTEIFGMAYPYGTFNDKVIRIAEECGIKYSRTVFDAPDFAPQKNLMVYRATCHHKNDKLWELLDSFLSYKGNDPAIFCLWGHSYEFDVDDNWERIEEFCRRASGHDDIFYGTNSEVLLSK
ncbi:MAG: polysaccharide deacetylase [Ruminococcus sp.]|nr:polysaccharide deacetylase [Ruminococcus sp.]